MPYDGEGRGEIICVISTLLLKTETSDFCPNLSCVSSPMANLGPNAYIERDVGPMCSPIALAYSDTAGS